MYTYISYMYMCKQVHLRICMAGCKHACVRAFCLSVCLSACLPGWLAGWLSVCVSVCLCVCVYVSLCVMYVMYAVNVLYLLYAINACFYVFVCVCAHVSVYVSKWINIIYIYVQKGLQPQPCTTLLGIGMSPKPLRWRATVYTSQLKQKPSRSQHRIQQIFHN